MSPWAPSTEIQHVTDHSAAPVQVTASLARLVSTHPEAGQRLAADLDLARALVTVMAASRSLARLCEQDPVALDVVAAALKAGPRPLPPPERVSDLIRTKHLGILAIAVRDLMGLDALEQVGASLAGLADDVLSKSLVMALSSDGEPAGRPWPDCGLAVIGMGKLGGYELNYASDIDLMFVVDDPESAKPLKVLGTARSCFRVDTDLRPEGRSGPLARSLDSYAAYWSRWAKTWEFQALLKCRYSAGDATLGAGFVEEAGRHIWGRAFGADEIFEIRSMKARAESEMARRGISDLEVKRGRGGIRDIEFAVQLLQLVHGRADQSIRSPTTLTALAALSGAGYVSPQDATVLDRAYRFLRQVEHRIQLVDESQGHTVPQEPSALAHLARVMGYRDQGTHTAAEAFLAALGRHQTAVRTIHERLFFRPLLEVFTASKPGGAPAMEANAVAARLGAFGFADVGRTRIALRELTRGLTRSSSLMQALLPVLLEWLSESPDPELGLLGLRTLASGQHRRDRLVTTFRESPQAAQRLCQLIGTSRLVLDPLARNPDLISELSAADGPEPASALVLLDQAQAIAAGRQTVGAKMARLARMRQTETTRIAIRDILGTSDSVQVGSELSALAEAAMRAALELAGPSRPMSVLSMGRFGGSELSYASDIDILIAYEGGTDAQNQAALETAETFVRLVHGPTPAQRIFTIDTSLRPEGRQGPVARSLEGFANYYSRWAQTWERQALLRVRPVAGDAELGNRFMELVDHFVFSSPLTDVHRREIRRMKARIERERIPPDEDPQFHLKLGRGSLSDVEWTAQLLQLEHGVRSTGTVRALEALQASGALSKLDADVLTEAYRFCETTRNRWFLVHGGPGDSLPRRPEQLIRLSRSLGTTPTGLRDHYRRVTRRARGSMERLFYGKV